jgi:hypothetical protein
LARPFGSIKPRSTVAHSGVGQHAALGSLIDWRVMHRDG